MARATDATGATQPLAEDWNPSSYLWNVVPRVRVGVGSGSPAAQSPGQDSRFSPNVKQAVSAATKPTLLPTGI
jgi:hypothetical protein